MKKDLYIPFATILKEFNANKSKQYSSNVYICHQSPTFENLWDSHRKEIKQLAAKFLKEKEIDPEQVYTSAGCCLFYGTLEKMNQAKVDFLVWGAEKNKRKKKLQTAR